MRLATAIKRATSHLLKSKNARTYHANVYGERKSFVVELERCEDKTWLKATGWGADDEGIAIPQTRPELIALKCRAQLGMVDYPQVAKRYYLDILHREANG